MNRKQTSFKNIIQFYQTNIFTVPPHHIISLCMYYVMYYWSIKPCVISVTNVKHSLLTVTCIHDKSVICCESHLRAQIPVLLSFIPFGYKASQMAWSEHMPDVQRKRSYFLTALHTDGVRISVSNSSVSLPTDDLIFLVCFIFPCALYIRLFSEFLVQSTCSWQKCTNLAFPWKPYQECVYVY